MRLLTTGVTVLAVAGGSTVAFGTPAHADPGPFVVTTNADSGPGSLRSALATAQTVSSDDTITFDPTVTGTIALTSGELDTAVGGTSGNLVIEGPGSGHLSVDAGGLSRVLSVVGPGGDVRPTVAVSGLTLTRGDTWPVDPQDGGAVRVTGGDLTLSGDVVSNSHSGKSGGGVSVMGGSLTVLSSTITGNTTTTGEGFIQPTPQDGGGGLSVDAGGVVGAVLVVTDSTLSGNTTAGRGGGIRAFGGVVATVTRSTVTGNTASHTFRGQDVESTVGQGGGISAPELTLVDSSVAGNEAGQNGGGVAGRDVVVTSSTIAHNRAGVSGGGLDVAGTGPGAGLQVTSSTIWGNRAPSGGGISVSGDPSVELKLSTVSANEAVVGGGLDTNTDVSAEGSIVGMNQGGDLAGDAVATLSRSLVQDSRGVALADTGGSIIGADPLLGPLTDNGGPTQTSLPAPNSPVIDQGAAFDGVSTDQRGSTRSTDDPDVADAVDGSDMGAVELTPAEQADLPQVGSTARPTVTGTLRVGRTLHTDGGTWVPAAVTRTYQWFSNGFPIAGATSASYTLTAADYKKISVRVTAAATGYREGSALSEDSGFVGLGDLRVSRPASLTGRLRVGSTLHARARLGAISPQPAAAYYSWRVHGRLLRAHSSSLELKPWMRGKRVRVAIAYTAVPGYHRLVQEARGAHPVRAR